MKTDIEKLEKVQRKCLNMCTEPVEMGTLQFRRNLTDLVENYKYVNNMYKTPASSYFSKPGSELSRSSPEASSTVSSATES